MSEHQDKLSIGFAKLAFEAALKGKARVMALAPLIVRVKQGPKAGVRGGNIVRDPGRLLIALTDEAVVDLKHPENEGDLWLIVRVRRSFADVAFKEAEEEKIIRPTLVGLDGRPIT
jgi:hypothetical protein